MNSETQLKTALPELRTRYAKRLRTQSNELLDFIAVCERNSLNDDVRRDAQILAHNLRGTGTTFGYPEISQAASSLEAALEADATSSEGYVGLSLKLVRACNDAAVEASGVDSSADTLPEVNSNTDA